LTTSSEILLTTCIGLFISFETCFVICWMSPILSNHILRSEILCQIFSSWWDFGEVCDSCTKSAHSCCLVLKPLDHVHVYWLVQIEFLVADVSVWQSTLLELLLLTLRWYMSYLYMLVLLEIEVLMLVLILLKYLHNLISYLAPCYMFVIYWWSICEDYMTSHP
jgi:hypothetical protein